MKTRQFDIFFLLYFFDIEYTLHENEETHKAIYKLAKMKCLKLQVYEIKFSFSDVTQVYIFINIHVLLSYTKGSVTPLPFYKVLYTFDLSFYKKKKRIPFIAIKCIEDIKRGTSFVHLCC